MKNTPHTTGEKGFAILFAVLVSSVLLSIGLSIFNLTIKELVLSSSGRESQFAFYAADTGAECALYWDFKATEPYMYATTSGGNDAWRDSYIDANNPTCLGNINSLVNGMKNPVSSVLPPYMKTSFTLTIPNTLSTGTDAPYCAEVDVYKIDNNGFLETQINSRGYNTCDLNDPNRVERALKVTY